jgi:hypothetical protein
MNHNIDRHRPPTNCSRWILDCHKSFRFQGARILSSRSQAAVPRRSSGIRVVRTKVVGGKTDSETRALEKLAVGKETPS